jgi:hypothetical protein
VQLLTTMGITKNFGGYMAHGHSTTKRKRRHKSGNRKDYTAATMAKLKELQAKANAVAGNVNTVQRRGNIVDVAQ